MQARSMNMRRLSNSRTRMAVTFAVALSTLCGAAAVHAEEGLEVLKRWRVRPPSVVQPQQPAEALNKDDGVVIGPVPRTPGDRAPHRRGEPIAWEGIGFGPWMGVWAGMPLRGPAGR